MSSRTRCCISSSLGRVYTTVVNGLACLANRCAMLLVEVQLPRITPPRPKPEAVLALDSLTPLISVGKRVLRRSVKGNELQSKHRAAPRGQGPSGAPDTRGPIKRPVFVVVRKGRFPVSAQHSPSHGGGAKTSHCSPGSRKTQSLQSSGYPGSLAQAGSSAASTAEAATSVLMVWSPRVLGAVYG